ncbi:hypothetical protein [Dactylosporangium sp. CS-033363]|uniref:hypothetical protein n=1 Tax=Dactylosporangium sp. CS-033363 TaxID=3239935 RepID=UPI003D8DD82F
MVTPEEQAVLDACAAVFAPEDGAWFGAKVTAERQSPLMMRAVAGALRDDPHNLPRAACGVLADAIDALAAVREQEKR